MIGRRQEAKDKWNKRRNAGEIAEDFAVTAESASTVYRAPKPGDLSSLRRDRRSSIQSEGVQSNDDNFGDSAAQGNAPAAVQSSRGRRRSSTIAERQTARALSKEAEANIKRIKALGSELRRASVVVQGLFSDVDAGQTPKRPAGVTAREHTLRKMSKSGTAAPHDRG